MIIVDDERKHEYKEGTCHNCKSHKPVRPVQVYGFIARESRGFYDFCFDCFRPQIFWKAREDSQIIMSPAPNKA